MADLLGDFNGPFLGYLLAFGLVTLIFIFYFNRLVAFVLFGVLRTYTWLFFRVHVKCQAIQFSLLGGRIFLRGLSYHGENETILVHQLYVTWQYWYRRVAQEDVSKRKKEQDQDSSSGTSEERHGGAHRDSEAASAIPRRNLKCRISAQLRGVEWFVYNRSPAYDGILASAARTVFAQNQARQDNSEISGKAPNLDESDVSNGSKIARTLSADRGQHSGVARDSNPDPPIFLGLLPMHVECTKAAMVMGNQHTRSVLVAKVEHANGQIAAHPSSLLDVYRQSFEFEASKLTVKFIPNDDYIEPLLTAGARLNGVVEVQQNYTKVADNRHRSRSRHRFRHAISLLIPQFRRSVESFERRSSSLLHDEKTSPIADGGFEVDNSHWIGLTRYLDEEEEDRLEHDRWQGVEYAQSQTVADFSAISMNFYWDVPGYVGVVKASKVDQDAAEAGDINGACPPEWSLELRLGDGKVQYGPWADRQRVDFMTVFFPSSYMDVAPGLPLRTGQQRISTVFKILIILDGEVEMRVFTREASKDWKYKGLMHHETDADGGKASGKQSRASKQKKLAFEPYNRPAGWVSVTVAANTTVTYDMDMVPRENGFVNKLNVEAISPEIQSSVNQDVLLKSSSMVVSGDLSNPLKWNAHHTWQFHISSKDTDLFMLREHAFLIQDLVEDFTLGPPPAFYTFVPFSYEISLNFDSLAVYLNANEMNIIDKPSDIKENTFLVLEPRSLSAKVGIPADHLKPLQSSIRFDGTLLDTKFRVLTPQWNTFNSLMERDSVGTFPRIVVSGCYNYNSKSSSTNTDTLLMDIHGDKPEMYIYGFLIKYFLNFQENYFGKDVHFQTLEEYQGIIGQEGRKHAADNDHKPAKVTSDLDVILSVTTENPGIILPSTLYSASNSVKLSLEHGHADLRFTNYYMDLQTSLSPVSIVHLVQNSSKADKLIPEDVGVQTFIDGLTITGHRLFGLPPTEPTYACYWDFMVGDITGESSIHFLDDLVSGIQALIYELDDDENALPDQNNEPLNDVTFLRASIKPVRLWLLVDQVAFLAEMSESRVEFNDWSRKRFSERLFLSIPDIILGVVDRTSASQIRTTSQFPSTYGYLRTSLEFRMLQSNGELKEKRRKQQEHIALHDARTNRTPWLIRDMGTVTASRMNPSINKLQPPASQFPPIPDPLLRNFNTLSSKQSGKHDVRPSLIRKTSSFLLENDPRTRKTAPLAADNQVKGAKLFQPREDNVQTCQYEAQNKSSQYSDLRGGINFSSSYVRPHFSLQNVKISVEDVPEISTSNPAIRSRPNSGPYIEEIPNEDDGMIHISFIVSFGSGLRILCTPPALEGTNSLLSMMMSSRPDKLLDGLQMSSLKNAVSSQNISKPPKFVQVRVDLPSLALRLRHRTAEDVVSAQTRQSYEIALQNMTLFARIGAERPLPLGKTPTSVHASFSQLEIQASRSSRSNVHDAQVIGKLSELNFWVHEAEEVVSELKFHSLEFTSLNRKTQHLASLVNDAGSLADRLGNLFKATVLTNKARQQFLIHQLATQGRHVTDPSLLSSASFISRSSGNHVRASDSWKMLMRFRWILKNMDHATAKHLNNVYSAGSFDMPHDARAQVVAELEHWRGWEFTQLESCPFMKELYGKAAPADDLASPPKPVRASFDSEIILLTVDPLQKGNLILSERLSIAVESLIEPSTDESTFAKEVSSTSRHSVIQASCNKILVEIRLDLLDAVKGIFSHVKSLEASQETLQPILPEPIKHDLIRHDIHGVLLVKESILRLRTRNSKTTLRGDNCGSSILVHTLSPSEQRLRVLLSSRQMSLDSLSHSRPLLQLAFISPVLHVDLNRTITGDVSENAWGFGVYCPRITVEVQENILGLLALADLMINDEYIYLREFSSDIKMAESISSSTMTESHPTSNRFCLNLEIGTYKIITAVFSSLRYRLDGRGTRISMMPSKGLVEASHSVDIDIREHSHSIVNEDGDTTWEVMRLVMPPITGGIDLHQTANLHVIEVKFRVSNIKIDAASIHDLFSALSRTEISRFKKDVTRDIAIVKANFENVVLAFENQSQMKSPEVVDDLNTNIQYSAQIGVDGVAIVAQSKKSLKTIAELVLDSGPVTFSINNYRTNVDTQALFPNIGLQLKAVKVTLESLIKERRIPCGKVVLAFSIKGASEISGGELTRSYSAVVDSFHVDVYTETASMIIDILGYLQQRFRRFKIKEEIQTLRAKRRQRTISRITGSESEAQMEARGDLPIALFDAIITFQMRDLQAAWRVASTDVTTELTENEDLIFSIETIDLRTKRGNTAQLEIKNLCLQLVPQSKPSGERSKNSALLPEVVFRIAHRSTSKDRRLAFQALGKALDLRLTSEFLLPISNLQKSIAIATQDLRHVLADWNKALVEGQSEHKSFLSNKKLSSLVVDADFDGAVVCMEGRDASERMRSNTNRMSRHGRLGQYEDRNSTELTSPGIAFKVEYKDIELHGRSLGAEIKVAASENQLQPMFVPLILEIISSVKEIVGNEPSNAVEAKVSQDASVTSLEDMPDPATILGDCRLNLGLRICAQSFSLSCEPIAKVTATARFDDIYINISTVQPEEGERFFAVSSAITGLEAVVKHVFSRDPTGKFQISSINLSMMNSEHVNGMKGISSILNISPTILILNVKQLQDFLTFREIWYPVEIRPVPQTTDPSTEHSIGGVERYYQATAKNTFSWNAAMNISSLEVQLDLGQAVGRLTFSILKLWATSRKESVQEQNLCLGFDSIGITSKGRMSGSVELRNLHLRTSIVWPDEPSFKHAPLVQASLNFGDLRAKAALDYQTFAVADFQSLGFLLYNTTRRDHDKLICTVNGDKIHVYCAANVAAQSVALYQAVNRLIQEKLTSFEISLKQMERFQRQKAAAGLGLSTSQELTGRETSEGTDLTPMRLQVNVLVSLNALKVGVYPRSFTDNQIFKLEALDALARFGINNDTGNTHTSLTVVLGQLKVALSSISREQRPKALDEVLIEDVVKYSIASRGGTILKVPRVVATMETWQPLRTKEIEYIFKSSFEGKVEVGWNYARISFIRTMWDIHSKSLEHRLGKPLPQSTIQISRSPRPDAEPSQDLSNTASTNSGGVPQEKITAVVHVPLSKYTYIAREPSIIQTPQLRDMGEATPPLEWIGLQRDKLPNLTHQVVIIPLLGFASKVEDAYGKILGAKQGN